MSFSKSAIDLTLAGVVGCGLGRCSSGAFVFRILTIPNVTVVHVDSWRA